VESVTQGERTQRFGPFEYVANADLVRVLLKKDGGTIAGTIRDANRSAVPQALVVLAPKNRKATNRFLTGVSDKDGNFKFSAIAPGEYDLFAFTQNDEDSYQDEDYLRSFNSRSTAVRVDPGSAQTVQPELIQVGSR
jgi:hypothetical protein